VNWLITGGCGFIGTSLIKRLLVEGGHSIRIVDNLSVGNREDLSRVATEFSEVKSLASAPWESGTVELVVGDVLDDQLAIAAAKGMDAIVHLAANTGVQPSIENPRMDCLTNVVGTLNYLEAARLAGTNRFVFASSGGTVIGDCEPPINEEMVPHPKAPYGASKLAGEGYLSAYHGTFGIDTVALRFGNVYGPGSSHKNSVVAKFIRRALAGESLQVHGDGHQTRDFVFIDDLINAVIRSATRANVGGEVFQIASSSETSVNELANLMLPLLRERLPHSVELTFENELPGEIRRNFSDTSKACEKLGWRAEVDLGQGLERTIDWFMGAARTPA
jgi:UDP-glucose 4-epimerase